MPVLAELWLPILLSAVMVFIVSSIMHMLLPIHRGDYGKLSGEAEILQAMRAEGVAPGTYMFPCPQSMKDMASSEMTEKYKQGPVGYMTVLPNGVPGMGRSLIQWFLYSLLISFFVGYIGTFGLHRGDDWLMVFRMTGTVAILGYALSYLPDSIWKGLKWSITLKFVFDGIVYGLVTAATFSLLWPA